MSLSTYPPQQVGLGSAAYTSYEEGSFTVTGVGFSGTSPTATVRYIVTGKQVTVDISVLQGTSNQPYFVLTGWPGAIFPAVAQDVGFPVRISDSNGVIVWGLFLFTTASAVQVWTTAAAGSFASSGTKTLFRSVLSYLVA